ncbi:N-acetylmuramoyl-L-alanine amidase [Bacillus sp. ISL-51]|uniref:N-acetylmuramoyl-L-alanine amidase family protein n=1 Tax=unclassified Bacillus (in: firmicutes) TaxID=185979 RepID=UPI001BE823F9|nr:MULTISPECIES: N-acetylmuramoyl-L-alanine amidase [unclassified Bacillus (in: firmicutes)]MBT2574502.1 N-acetylmuramoyl-L-alanine amidase [Bacillus sp. ISL-51]MBT2633319.1 N-acetylmuramoyl-L-alanine amidase [Bacillus sp. ISL-26]
MGLLTKSAAAFGAALLLLAPSVNAAEPIQGKTIYIDAGHGGGDSGTSGSGLLEKNVNAAVSNRVIAKLDAEGAKPVASRTGDTFLSLDERVAKASASQSDLFVSLHANSGVSSAAGTETYFNSAYEGANSEKLASEIQHQLVSSLGTRDRGVKEAPFYVITYSKMPSVLAELGFITNPSDADKLKNNSGQEHAADAVVNGIEAYYENQ